MTVLTGPAPKYHQLAEILRRKILDGDYAPDEQLPTEAALCRTFNASRGTVRKALDMLTRQGFIRREQGRGTFVNPQASQHSYFTLTSFNEDMRRQHRQPGTRVLYAAIVPATADIARHLGIGTDDPVLCIRRLRLADGTPVVYETRYLAQSLCPQLLDYDLENLSVHDLLVHTCNLPLIRTVHTLEAHILTPDEAELLQTEPGSPAFLVDRLTYTVDDTGYERPAVWYTALFRGDEYHFKTEFQTSGMVHLADNHLDK